MSERLGGCILRLVETAADVLVLRAFAAAIMAKVSAARALKRTAPHRQRLLESISDDIKKVSNFRPHEVSVAAHAEAEALGIDLSHQTWHDQRRFDADREVFHVEHMVPVSVLRAACLAADDEGQVLDVLANRLRVVWILKSEDDELTRLGFRSRRPDADEAYRQAQIAIHRRDSR